MNFNLGITPDNVKKTVQLLNKLLSDEAVLYIKTLNYHWNVRGPHFDHLHLFLERQYEDLFDIIDSVAERVRTLNHKPAASMQEYLSLTGLQEDVHGDTKTDQEMIYNLLKDHEYIIRQAREIIPLIQDEYKDIGTANLLTDEVLEKQEKMAWMLRASLRSEV